MATPVPCTDLHAVESGPYLSERFLERQTQWTQAWKARS